jgi:hypothetical protein
MKRIELLNSEGPILIAEKIGDRFMMNFKQENYQIEIEHHDLALFIGGMLDIATPKKTYNYEQFPSSMKPDYMKVYEFMKRDEPDSIIYIASPYSHTDKSVREDRFEQISKITAQLNAEGIVAFSPITYGHTLLNYEDLPTNWSFWQNFCLSFLQHCDELWVYKMEGWEESKGIQEEIKFAKKKGIPIKYVEI